MSPGLWVFIGVFAVIALQFLWGMFQESHFRLWRDNEKMKEGIDFVLKYCQIDDKAKKRLLEVL